LEISEQATVVPTSVRNNDDEAQIDPHYLAPVPERPNHRAHGIKTSLLFVLFEYGLEEGIFRFKFSDQLSTIWRLEIFSNASFHSEFEISIAILRKKIREDDLWRNRLLHQHREVLERLTYPLPKRSGVKPRRKRGYSDKGSTRPLHQRFRTGSGTIAAVFAEDLQIFEKVVVFGRRPTVTYRRLPYSSEIGRLLDLGLLLKEGDFIIPNLQQEN